MTTTPQVPSRVGSFQARVARDVVVVDGPDATSFLQSLVSQDLDTVAVGSSAHTLLLQPQGKLLVDFYIAHVDGDEWWCICEAGFGGELAAGLKRFKIRVKADVREEAVGALALRGLPLPGAVATAAAVHVVAVDWPGGLAFDVVGPEGAIVALSDIIDAPGIDADAYEQARIEAGVPRQGFDTDERTIPQEAGLELVAVSFTKGCFVGQELVCRIDSRGRVNRHLRRLRSVAAKLERGTPVAYQGKEIGEITSAAAGVALAMLRREVEPGATVTVGADEALVEAL
ncbi:MAG: tRNA-modifying protein YgfZ [Actinomycetota bacterium]|jgi:folate-binding protein YgfZ|nr:tRNA-modifying protein YgfZ [Actinomycetota bacterium]